MPVPQNTIRYVQVRPEAEEILLEKNWYDGDGGGRRTLKRNKTFAVANGRQPQAQSVGNRRHRRGTKGRLTVPLLSAPTSPMIQNKYNDPLAPLYIQTSKGIFDEAFGDGKRNSLNKNQIDQLQAVLALPYSVQGQKQISPTASSGFGSTEALTSLEVSPKSKDVKKIESKFETVNPFRVWILLCIQYVVYYFRRISTKARRSLETTPAPPRLQGDTGILSPESGLVKKMVPGVKRRLKFDDEIELIDRSEQRKFLKLRPYYTELHLGRKSKFLTNLAALEGENLEYPTRKYIDRASETKYITTVFEIRQRGLEEIAVSVPEEIQRWYGEQADNLIIVCCEMQWSTPDKYRNVVCEMRLKDQLNTCLRVNNRRVLNAVSRRNEKAIKLDKFLMLPESITEESVGRNQDAIGCFGGSYRRYYKGLLPWGHREAAVEHQPWWELKKHQMPESINWPLIATKDKTSVILLNLVCLKLDRL